MKILGLLSTAAALALKLMDKTPSYDQKKREKFNVLWQRYEEENSKDIPFRDDQQLDDLRDKLHTSISSFNKELSQ